MPPRKSQGTTGNTKKKAKPNEKKKASQYQTPIESIDDEKESYSDAYLFSSHPGLSIKERPLAVKNVIEITGERKDEYDLDTEYLLLGDDMKEHQWVSSCYFYAPDKIDEFKRKAYKKVNESKPPQKPLSFTELMIRKNRMIPTVSVVPKTILYSFSQSVKGNKQEFFMVKDDQNRNIIMLQETVKSEFPLLFQRYISAFFGFEVAK